MWLTGLATLATALFTGAALYVSLVEQPARMACPTDVAIAEWRPSYARATIMQASLAVAATAVSVVHADHGQDGTSWKQLDMCTVDFGKT